MKPNMNFPEEGIVPSHVKGEEGRYSHIPTCEDWEGFLSVSPSFNWDRGDFEDTSVAGLLKSKFNMTHI